VLYADDAAHAGRWGEAIEHYESLRAQTGSKDAAILNNLAWAYGKAGKADRAIAVAGAAYALEPENPAIADTLGWLLHESGRDKARALKLLRQAAAKAPQIPGYRWHLANALAAAGQQDEARTELQAALLRPDFKDGDQARALLAKL
jgi:tetratricopeptide (TPR) repeat protein